LKFRKETLKRHGPADRFVTDCLRSYGAVLRELGLCDKQETGRWADNLAENSHLPIRRRERAMLRFRRIRTLQKFASVHASVFNHFNQERSLSSRDIFKANRAATRKNMRHQDSDQIDPGQRQMAAEGYSCGFRQKEAQGMSETQDLSLPVVDIARKNDEGRKVSRTGGQTQLLLAATSEGGEIGGEMYDRQVHLLKFFAKSGRTKDCETRRQVAGYAPADQKMC
jgi:hypothetical protein